MAGAIFSFDDGRNGRLPPAAHAAGWTYFLQAIVADGPIKIGKATNIWERFRSLQGGNHLEIRFLGALPFAEVPERQLHRIFAAEHIRGEWFRPHRVMFALADLGNAIFGDRFRHPQGRGRLQSALPLVANTIRRMEQPSADDLLAAIRIYEPVHSPSAN